MQLSISEKIQYLYNNLNNKDFLHQIKKKQTLGQYYIAQEEASQLP